MPDQFLSPREFVTVPRKPRGRPVEVTPLMQSLEDDPAQAMQALSEDAARDWETNSLPANRNLLEAAPDDSQSDDS